MSEGMKKSIKQSELYPLHLLGFLGFLFRLHQIDINTFSGAIFHVKVSKYFSFESYELLIIKMT